MAPDVLRNCGSRGELLLRAIALGVATLVLDCNSNPNAAKEAAEQAERQAAWDKTIASPPDPPPEPVLAAAAPGAPKRLTLKPTVSSFKGWFEKLDIVFEQNTPLADGTPRLVGKHSDGYTMVELIGHGEALERASVMMGLVKEAGPLARNTGAVMVFMRETGWENGWKWATDSIGKGRVTKRHGSVDYVMQTIGDTGVCVLSADPTGTNRE